MPNVANGRILKSYVVLNKRRYVIGAYIQRTIYQKMFKEYISIENSPSRLSYSLFLKLKNDEPMLMLKHSLIFDGRFYGAEWVSE